MVIFLRNKNELIKKIVIIIFLIVFIYGSGYLFSYLRYRDKNMVINGALKVENEVCREKIEGTLKLKYEGSYVIGKVIFRDIHSFYKEIMIDVGSNDSIKVGDAVINSEGLVGVVFKVLPDTSYVKLISGNYNVSVKVNDTYGNLNNGVITLLDKYSEINVGDEVYTSGLSNIVGNIYVGKISDVNLDANGLGKEVKVELVFNRDLNYVAIMRGA